MLLGALHSGFQILGHGILPAFFRQVGQAAADRPQQLFRLDGLEHILGHSVGHCLLSIGKIAIG